MTRDELLDAGARALAGVRVEDDAGADPKGDAVAAVIGAVEELIRADERERADQAGWMPASLIYDNLRAKVEALPGISFGKFADPWVRRGAVLDLIDGSSDE